jgi:uncharacterized protein (TIGR02145 family)
MKRVFTTLAVICIFLISCKKKDSAPPTLPAVTTSALTNITTSGATVGGKIVSNGGATITARGIVWSQTSATPTLVDSVVTSTATADSFSTNITGLEFNRVYYIRAYATNSVGTSYGSAVTLNTANDSTKVRFTYNGQEVVYGVIISPTTGKKWLDRNLGAKRTATAVDDYQAYGDMFQWGRPTDGHQLINWTSATAGTQANGVTATLATSDNPGHNNFIDGAASSRNDWRSDNNNNRWATNPQGPCPSGWHVPIKAEWAAEVKAALNGGTGTSGITGPSSAFNLLKLTSVGYRQFTGSSVGQPSHPGERGYYWASSVGNTNYSNYMDFGDGYAEVSYQERSCGSAIRCIHD